MTCPSLALSEMLQRSPGIMPGVSSVVCIILLYSGRWETGTDGRTGTIYSSFEGVALPASTPPLLAMSLPQPAPQTHVPTAPLLIQSVLVSKEKILPTFKAGKKIL